MPFTEAECELIAVYVSGMDHCRYCHSVHTATAERLGVAAGAVKQVIDDSERAPIADRLKPVLRPVLRYAETLTRAERRATRADTDAILAPAGRRRRSITGSR